MYSSNQKAELTLDEGFESNLGARELKIRRIQEGAKPRVLDLFSGCGGLSLGFKAAGMSIDGAIEIDPLASLSHGINFFGNEDDTIKGHHSEARDATIPPGIFADDMGFEDSSLAVDVIVGGPPCQAFARVGRAKLREIIDHPEAFKADERAPLYLHYIKYIEEFQPLAVVMENVPDVMNFGGRNIPQEVCETLEERGYNCKYTLLNSAMYGVPQMRERMFLVAYVKELDVDVLFPKPSHYHELPRGYKGARQVALKNVTSMFSDDAHFVPTREADKYLTPAVTVEEALKDLPKITLHLEGKLKRGARRFDKLIPYVKNQRLNDYALLMRNWEGYESSEGIFDHVIRYLPRDYDIFREMKPGDQYPEAHRLAEKMLEQKVKEELGVGAILSEVEARKEELRSVYVPPYDPTKFPNKWRKMEADAPARTLMAHLGKDGYSHIHYDSTQARTISVREAARLQSFPDGFKFSGTMNPAFRQIGNAVPPLLAKAVAEEVRKALLGGNT